MSINILDILLIIAILATVGSLAFGIFCLVKGGDFNKKYGNVAMRWRVLFQGITLLILALLFLGGR